MIQSKLIHYNIQSLPKLFTKIKQQVKRKNRKLLTCDKSLSKKNWEIQSMHNIITTIKAKINYNLFTPHYQAEDEDVVDNNLYDRMKRSHHRHLSKFSSSSPKNIHFLIPFLRRLKKHD